MKFSHRQFLAVSAASGVVGAIDPTAKACTLRNPPARLRWL